MRHIVGLFMTSALHHVHGDLRRSFEQVRQDEDAFGGPAESIPFHSNSVFKLNGTRNFEVYVMNPDKRIKPLDVRRPQGSAIG